MEIVLRFIKLLYFVIIFIISSEVFAITHNQSCEEVSQLIFEETLNDLPSTIKTLLHNKVLLNWPSEFVKHSSNINDSHIIINLESLGNHHWKFNLNRESLCVSNNLIINSINLKKAFVHFIGHIFNEIDLISFFYSHLSSLENQEISKIMSRCYNEYQWNATPAQVSPVCHLFWSSSESILNFKNFPDFQLNSLSSENKNERFSEILTSYVYKESFSCDNPALFNFLEENIGLPPGRHRCFDQLKFNLHDQKDINKQFIIDPSRVWQIQYLLIADGDPIYSKFGHSKFRIILCSSKRKVVGPDCINDIESHIVFGFAAQSDENKELSIVKGLTGEYPTELAVYNYTNVIEHYSIFENRSIKSYPLNFNQYEIRQFLSMAYELINNNQLHKYSFITNNCATSSFNLIQKSLKSPLSPFHLERSGIITPKNLLLSLQKSSLVLANQAEEITEASLIYTFELSPSIKTRINKMSQSDLGLKTINNRIDFEKLVSLRTSQDIYNWALDSFKILALSNNKQYWNFELGIILFSIEATRERFIKMNIYKELKKIFLQTKNNDFNNNDFLLWLNEFQSHYSDSIVYQELKRNEENLIFFKTFFTKK